LGTSGPSAGPSTPHFALQVRNRIQRLIEGLPEDDPGCGREGWARPRSPGWRSLPATAGIRGGRHRRGPLDAKPPPDAKQGRRLFFNGRMKEVAERRPGAFDEFPPRPLINVYLARKMS